MRTTLNISEKLIKEAQSIYNVNSKSEMVEQAMKDAIRLRKIQDFMKLKGKIEFNEKSIDELRSAEIGEPKNNS